MTSLPGQELRQFFLLLLCVDSEQNITSVIISITAGYLANHRTGNILTINTVNQHCILSGEIANLTVSRKNLVGRLTLIGEVFQIQHIAIMA